VTVEVNSGLCAPTGECGGARHTDCVHRAYAIEMRFRRRVAHVPIHIRRNARTAWR
jgi:hypothetical protein